MMEKLICLLSFCHCKIYSMFSSSFSLHLVTWAMRLLSFALYNSSKFALLAEYKETFLNFSLIFAIVFTSTCQRTKSYISVFTLIIFCNLVTCGYLLTFKVTLKASKLAIFFRSNQSSTRFLGVVFVHFPEFSTVSQSSWFWIDSNAA